MRPPTLRILEDELIVDSFAGGGGASLGIEMAIQRSPDIAMNHNPEALAMHAANHPNTRHLCADVWDVDPVAVCGGRRVGLFWASPDCTHHSKAKGGKPRDKAKAEKSRGLAWVVVRWAREVKPRVIFLENVEEFANWGPLLDNGKPDKAKRGLTFRIWLGQLKAAGYEVEMRELRASDYGAPTFRKRLFIIARSDGQPIVWPEPTHGPGRARPHRTAAECIDWAHPCPSIFEREKPLAEKTLRRIARGIMRFVVDNPRPFIIPATHARVNDSAPHSVDQPLRTVTAAHRGELELIVPSLVRSDMHKSNASCTYPIDEPLHTITTGGGHALVSSTLIQTGYGERPGQAPRAIDIQKPLGTIIAGGTNGNGNGKHALVSAFLAKHYGDPERAGGGGVVLGSQLTLPVGSVTTRDHHSLVTSHMLKLRGTCRDGRPIDEPSPTVTANGTHLGEVRAFLVQYNGTSEAQPVQMSLNTVTTHDRFGLVYVHGEPYAIADIGMRMLQPRELFNAQGFPDSYVIDPVVTTKQKLPARRRAAKGEKRKRRTAKMKTGPLTKTAQIRMCGNSVCPPIAAALVLANFADARAEVA